MTPPTIGSTTLSDFTRALAARQPVPGGGAASAVVLAQAAALGSMVIAYTVDKSKFAEHEPRLRRLATLLDEARSEALALADRDAAAYLALNALWKLPREERVVRSDWHEAVTEAIASPSTIADLSMGVLAALKSLDGITSHTLASDLAIARRFAHAALHGALLNVAVNVPQVTDASEAKVLDSWVASRRHEGDLLSGIKAPIGG
ncbi:MAG: formimidoyltetrahydrofolate cyclodeaminase [Phycisphaerales bacterium]|nr:formimidoyltetrahydrofolate cyclodeaminase [Phycisphaerales bacterium]